MAGPIYDEEKEPVSPETEDLKRQEKAADSSGTGEHDDRVGHGYTGDKGLEKISTIQPSVSGVVKFAKTNRGKIVIGGTVAGIVTLMIIGFFALIPWKILHVVTNLQERFFATSENAISKETDQLFSSYIKRYVIPGLRTCKGSTIDLKCTPSSNFSDSLVGNLYRGWSTARLENKLATKYGIEFKFDDRNKTHYLKAPGMSGDGVNLSKFIDDPDSLSLNDFIDKSPEFDKFDKRNEFRRAVKQSLRQALKDETLWTKTMYKYKVTRLLAKKYGLRMCIVSCKLGDKFDDFKDKRKVAARMFFAQRVLEPRSAMLGIVMQCLLTPDCHPDKIKEQAPVEVDRNGCRRNCELNGAHVSDTEFSIQQKLDNFVASYGNRAKVTEVYEKLSKTGFKRYLAGSVVASILGTASEDRGGKEAKEAKSHLASRLGGKAIPVLGQVWLATDIFNSVDQAGPKLQKLSYVTNAAAMTQTFTLYRTYADEIKSGNADAGIVGSFTESLSAGLQCNSEDGSECEDQLGGTASAEQTPLYAAIMNAGTANSSNANAFNLFSPPVFAASNSKYSCNDKDGKETPLPAGALVCPEENLKQTSQAIDALNALRDEEAWGLLRLAFGAIGSITSKVGEVINYIIKAVIELFRLGFLLDAVENALKPFEKLIEPLVDFFMKQLLPPSPVGSSMSGGRMFNMMAGGADVAGNDFAHHGLGGKALNKEEIAQNLDAYYQAKQDEFNSKPFFAKLFDKDNPKSFISRLALSLPSNTDDMKVSSVAFLSNPLNKLGNIFSALFTKPTYAVTGSWSSEDDPFGVTQYGYPLDDSVFSTDPEQYWLDNCTNDEKTKNWNKEGEDNSGPNTSYMPKNISTNPCLLIQTAAGSAGALFTDEVLTPDERAEKNASDATTNNSTAGSSIDLSNVFSDSSNVACAPPTRDLGIHTGYRGGSPVNIRLCALPNLPSTGEESRGGYGVQGGGEQAVVNSRVSGAFYQLVEAAKSDGLIMYANSGFRTMAHQQDLCPCDGVRVAFPGYSNHQMGVAVDFGTQSHQLISNGDQWFNWLSSNAAKFGIKNYPAEAWHWSPDGH